MDVQRHEDGDVPASISDVHDDVDVADDHDDSGDDDDDDDDAGDDADADNANDDAAADDDNDMDDDDSCEKLLPVYALIMMSLRRIPSWGQGNDPEKMMIILTFSVNLRALKIPDHCSPCKGLRYLLYHLLRRLVNLLPSDFVLLMLQV